MKATFLRCMGLSAATLLSVHFLATVAFAQTDVWLGGTGNWSDASKWSGGVPTATSNVFIDNGNGKASAVTVDIPSAACGNLSVDADDSLTIQSGATLTVNGTSVVNNGEINIIDNPSSAVLNIAAGKAVTPAEQSITLEEQSPQTAASLGITARYRTGP